MSAANALTVISDDIYAVREQFDAVLCDHSINFEREAGFALQLLSASDFSIKTAMANRQSVINAVTNIAAIGISLNPAKKQAYLVPRDGKICLDISYMGLMDLAMATGSVRWAQAAIVYERDQFSLNGFDKPPSHTFNPFDKDRGNVVGVYVVVKTADSEYLTHTMTIADVYAIRDRSSAWKSGRSCPWRTDEGEMIKKTCVKQAYKYWPKTDRLETAIHHLNTEGGEGLADIIVNEPAKSVPIHSATQGDIPISAERKQIIDAVANAVIDHFNANDVIGAYEECQGIEDSEEKVALWRLLPSNIRSAIKKHGESLKAQAA